jgi:hypothetical protein
LTSGASGAGRVLIVFQRANCFTQDFQPNDPPLSDEKAWYQCQAVPDSTTCLSSDRFAFVGKLSNCQIQFDSIESLHG